MADGLMADYMALRDWEYRRVVLDPIEARKAGWRRELRLMRQVQPAPAWKALTRRIGNRLRGAARPGAAVRGDLTGVSTGKGAQRGA